MIPRREPTPPSARNIGFGESPQVEFKESWNDDAVRKLASFANTEGGAVWVGVDKVGRLRGTDVGDDAQLRIANQVVSKLQIIPTIRVDRSHGTEVLVVGVEKAPDWVLYDGNIPVRVGTATMDLPREQWGERILARTGRKWDGLVTSHGVDVLDPNAVVAFIRRAKAQPHPRVPPEVTEDTPPDIVVESLQLVMGDRLTNAAMLLFGRRPQQQFVHARVRIARFRSIDDFDTYPPIEGTLLDQIEHTITIVNEFNAVQVDFSDPITRSDSIPQPTRRATYPAFTIREAIVNALVHRDYSGTGDVQVSVYDDHIEVWSPGGLPAGVTVESLRQEKHPSVQRNPLLADVADRAGFVEQWGTGTTRMIRACAAAHLPTPLFDEISGGFRVTLYRDPFAKTRLVALGLNERQLAVLDHLKREGRIDAATYRRITGSPKPTATRDLDDLVSRGIIRPVGVTGRGRYYVLGTAGLSGGKGSE